MGEVTTSGAAEAINPAATIMIWSRTKVGSFGKMASHNIEINCTR
jgi:hypothetical protein